MSGKSKSGAVIEKVLVLKEGRRAVMQAISDLFRGWTLVLSDCPGSREAVRILRELGYDAETGKTGLSCGEKECVCLAKDHRNEKLAGILDRASLEMQRRDELNSIKGRQYIVTDPGFLVPDDETWDKFSKLFNVRLPSVRHSGENLLENYLGVPVWVSDTGIGDWENCITGPGVIRKGFAADYGMVCVCELTDGVRKKLEQCCRDSEGIAAVFESRGVEKVWFDTSDPSWTVVHIYAAEGETVSAGSEEETRLKTGNE